MVREQKYPGVEGNRGRRIVMEHTDFGEKVIHKKEDLWRDLKGHREWAYGA